jgi:hypothetical protein
MPKKKQTSIATKTRAQGARELLATLPGVAEIAQKFKDTELSMTLVMPSEETLALLVDPDKVVNEAKAASVDTDDEYKLAKAADDSLKDEADLIESERTKGTKPLNSLKGGWDALFVPARNARKTASGIYQGKMRAYEAKLKAEDEATRKKQAEEAEAQRAELLRQAEEKKRRAAALKKPALKEEALREAESLEQAASLIPTGFGRTEASLPSLGSGGKQDRWVGEVVDDEEFLGWLWKERLWIKKIIGDYLQSGLNDLAKAVKDGKKIPGFVAKEASSYRRESRKKDQGLQS